MSDLNILMYASRRQADPPPPFNESRAMAGQVGKAQHTWVCEHLPEPVLHPNLKNQMRIPLAGQRSH
jgi:hypothetical protein